MGMFHYFATAIYVFLGPEGGVPFFVRAAGVKFDPRGPDMNGWVQCTEYWWVYDHYVAWQESGTSDPWPYDHGGTWGEWLGHFRAIQAETQPEQDAPTDGQAAAPAQNSASSASTAVPGAQYRERRRSCERR